MAKRALAHYRDYVRAITRPRESDRPGEHAGANARHDLDRLFPESAVTPGELAQKLTEIVTIAKQHQNAALVYLIADGFGSLQQRLIRTGAGS